MAHNLIYKTGQECIFHRVFKIFNVISISIYLEGRQKGGKEGRKERKERRREEGRERRKGEYIQNLEHKWHLHVCGYLHLLSHLLMVHL